MTTQEFTPDYIVIQLTRGLSTRVSPEDADLANRHWYASFNKQYKGVGNYTAEQSSKHASGYRTSIKMHRVILERMLGRKLLQLEYVDHIDGNPLNNTRNNLRLATPTQNQQNKTKQHNNKSGYKGVSWHVRDRKWIAQIVSNKRYYFLGGYDTPEEAYAAYCEKAKELHGEFANLD
jgi:hypothetical protein